MLTASCCGGAALAQGTSNPAVDALTQSTARIEAEIENNTKALQLLQQQFPVITGGKQGDIRFGDGKGAYAIGAWESVYQRMVEAASDVCARLDGLYRDAALQNGVVLASEDDLQLPAAYILVTSERQRLQGELDAILRIEQPPPSPSVGPSGAAFPIAAAGALINSAVSVSKLFRTDRTLYPEAVTVSLSALKDEVAMCLADRRIGVVYPALATRHTLLGSGDSPFLDSLRKLAGDRQRVELRLAQLPAASKPTAAATLLAQVDKFIADLVATPSQGEAPLASVIRGESIQKGLEQNRPLLVVSVPQQGGLSMVTSSIWRSDRLYVGGGMIVAYSLSTRGRIIASGTVSKVDPRMKRVVLD
jgi:hypothetical protein